MTRRARRDRFGRDARRAQTFGVAVGREIAGERTEALAAVEPPRRSPRAPRSCRRRAIPSDSPRRRRCSRKCSRLCAAVRSLPARILSCTSTGTMSGIAASTGIAHHGTSISIRSSMISSPSASRAGTPHVRASQHRCRARSRRRSSGHAQRAGTICTSSSALSQIVRSRNVS